VRQAELTRAEELFQRQLWADAEKAFLTYALRSARDPSAAASAFCRAGVCRLSAGNDRGAEELFERVLSDPAAAKNAPDAAAAAFDQLHVILLKQGKRPAREKLIARCRKALPDSPAAARIAEREGDARLEAGAADRALEYYALAGRGLSAAGADTVRLLSPKKSGLSLPPLSESDAGLLAGVAAAKPACAPALCDLLSKRGDGWRAENVRARLLADQKKFAEAAAVWESLLKSGQGPADAMGLSLAEMRGFAEGDCARAAALYKAWLERHAGSPLREKAEYQYAGVLWMGGRHRDAVGRFEAFLAEHPDSPYGEDAERTLARARTDLESQLRAAAAKAAVDPLSGELAAAEAKMAQGDCAGALRLFNRFRGRQSSPQWGRAWYGYGLCRRALGEPEKALETWDEVLRQAALFTNTLCAAECRRARADALFEDLAEPGKALPEYLAARESLPPDRRPDDALEQRVAQVLLALGRGAEARPVFEAFRSRESGDPLRVRYWDGLIALCNAPAAIDPRTSEERKADFLKKVADVHFASECWDKAASLYLKAAKAAPASETAAWSEMQRGRCLARLNRPEKALDVYDRFKTEYRRSAWADDALLRAGVLCAGPLGDAKRAGGYFREILAAHPDGDQAEAALLYLATLAWWGEEWAEAGRLNKAFLEKYPDSPFREEILSVRLPAIARRSNAAVGTAGQEASR